MLEVLGFAGIVVAVFVPLFLRFEHRVTKLEGKVDSLLKHNGIDPENGSKPKRRRP